MGLGADCGAISPFHVGDLMSASEARARWRREGEDIESTSPPEEMYTPPELEDWERDEWEGWPEGMETPTPEGEPIKIDLSGIVAKLKNLFQPKATETQDNKDIWLPIVVLAGCLILVFIVLGSGRK